MPSPLPRRPAFHARVFENGKNKPMAFERRRPGDEQVGQTLSFFNLPTCLVADDAAGNSATSPDTDARVGLPRIMLLRTFVTQSASPVHRS